MIYTGNSVDTHEAGKAHVLKSFPSGYQLYDHNKGKADAPRHDPYLYGAYVGNSPRIDSKLFLQALLELESSAFVPSMNLCLMQYGSRAITPHLFVYASTAAARRLKQKSRRLLVSLSNALVLQDQ